MEIVRVRIAPSPTGIPHIGNTRTALFNYFFARKHKGEFLLRIEDTDQKRIVPGSKEAIFEILEWLSLTVDGKPFIQSEHTDVYKTYIQQLIEKGVAYEKEGAIWITMPTDREYAWDDAVGKKHIVFPGSDQKDFVAIKSDGFPTYHFASVVDDHLMKITHVIRGYEWISSTPKHLLLYESFAWEPPVFAHLPIILGPDKQKLSKRHGAKSALDYRDEGYLPQALTNFMALLGWNPGGDKEIMSVNEMISLFTLEDVNNANPIFDVKKLEWMNGMYLRSLPLVDLKKQIEPFFPDIEKEDPAVIDKLLMIVQTRIKTLTQVTDVLGPFLSPQKLSLSSEDNEIRNALKDTLSGVAVWDKDNIATTIKTFLREKNVAFPKLYEVVIGTNKGLPLADTFEALGKEKTLALLA